MKYKIALTALIICLIALGGAGCLDSGEREGLTIEGSSTVLPVTDAAAEAFEDKYGISVSLSGGGSSHGITSVAEERIDLGMASRLVSQDEIDRYGDNFEKHVIGYDGVAIVVSEEIYNEGVQDLTVDEVRDIYSGEIQNWEEVGGPDREILTVSREEGSGTGSVFYSSIEIDRADASLDQVSDGNAMVKQSVANSDKAIGFLGLGYVGDGAESVAIDGVEPTSDNILAGEYPIDRSLQYYSWGPVDGEAEKFIEFILSEEGQEIVENEGYIPLQ
ncbi:ABC-type phosphate transport system periplasmic component [Methanonatronarchaeum thermophilum]|uniref:ABC-type phosphate transport system periplasmic component n=1 Tax=Methanonatronarchaeum thermophilum TaxID=1927129 RepID=A0A1Y3GAM1_9EURY|nr:phosphate ABC transporter substrate-binding protein [Methanonatronarchaeum thermophilum]OUJ18290.1 ABC-type phosphate transport system periplasmic component [Methanonatronarchaeum thermophilum]